MPPEHDVTTGFFGREDTREAITQFAMSKEPLTIFVGAGVAADQGVPTWQELVQFLLADQLTATTSQPAAAAEYIVNNYLQLPTASIVDQMFLDEARGDKRAWRSLREERIRERLYRRRRSQVQKPSLAEYLLRLAVAAYVLDRDVHIVTTNYDDTLERQASESEMADMLAGSAVSVRPYWRAPPPAAEQRVGSGEIPIVHLHGFLPHGSGGGNPVFSEHDYHDWAHRSPFKDYLARDRFATGQVLFIGTSLRDHNILAILESARRPALRVALLPVQGDPLANHFPLIHEMHAFLTLRGRHLGVKMLRPSLYSQVYQFLQEVASMSTPALSVPARYGQRLQVWSDRWEKSGRLTTEGRAEVMGPVVELRNWMLDSVGAAEHVKIEIWARCGEGQGSLRRWMSSQSILTGDANARPHETPVVDLGHYAAVDAFAHRGAQIGSFLPEDPARWTDYFAVAIVLYEEPYFGLPVGVALAVLNCPGEPERAEGTLLALERQRAEITERLINLGTELLRPATNDQADAHGPRSVA